MIETQQNTISEDLVNKVKGLLRLATSSNQHEAELAMQRAKALCVKYALDMASLDAFDDGKPKNNEPIIKDKIEIGKRMPVTQAMVSQILIKHFNVRLIYSGGRWGGKRINFIGRQRDVELATWLNSYLNEKFASLWHSYYKNNESRGVTLREKSGFIWGLQQGLSEKLRESQKVTEEETFTSTPMEKIEQVKQSYALAIVNHERNLEDKVCEFYPHLRKSSRTSNIRSYNSIGAGRAMGRNISINRPISDSSRNSLTY